MIGERRGSVDDHVLVVAFQQTDDLRNGFGGDRLRQARLERRGQQEDLPAVRRQVSLQRVGVETIEVLSSVVDRARREELQHDRQVAELQVEVDHRDLLPGLLRQRDREVGRHETLAAAALRAEHRDHLVIGDLACFPPGRGGDDAPTDLHRKRLSTRDRVDELRAGEGRRQHVAHARPDRLLKDVRSQRIGDEHHA